MADKTDEEREIMRKNAATALIAAVRGARLTTKPPKKEPEKKKGGFAKTD